MTLPDPPATQVSSTGSSIFKIKKGRADTGTKLTVIFEVNGNVSGGKVKRFEAYQVESLGRIGPFVRIRLKNQRFKTAAVSALR